MNKKAYSIFLTTALGLASPGKCMSIFKPFLILTKLTNLTDLCTSHFISKSTCMKTDTLAFVLIVNVL